MDIDELERVAGGGLEEDGHPRRKKSTSKKVLVALIVVGLTGLSAGGLYAVDAPKKLRQIIEVSQAPLLNLTGSESKVVLVIGNRSVLATVPEIITKDNQLVKLLSPIGADLKSPIGDLSVKIRMAKENEVNATSTLKDIVTCTGVVEDVAIDITMNHPSNELVTYIEDKTLSDLEIKTLQPQEDIEKWSVLDALPEMENYLETSSLIMITKEQAEWLIKAVANTYAHNISYFYKPDGLILLDIDSGTVLRVNYVNQNTTELIVSQKLNKIK